MTCVVFAYHDVGCAGLRTLRRLGIDVGLVYTHDDDPTERTWFGSVRATCAELGLQATTADPHLPAEIERLRALRPVAYFSLYYRNMIKESVLSIPSRGGVNLHGSFLPRYRGRAPVNWMLLHGETQGGVSLHYMVRKADAGDLVDQEAFPIGPDDTAVDVYRKMLPAAELVLERSARAVVEGTAPRIEQLESKATYHGRRTPEDGRIVWRQRAEDVRNLVRAVTRPYPGAFTFASGVKVLVWWTTHAGAGTAAAPGTVARTPAGVLVNCGDRRLLRLDRVEIGGRQGDGLDFPEILRDGVVLGGGA